MTEFSFIRSDDNNEEDTNDDDISDFDGNIETGFDDNEANFSEEIELDFDDGGDFDEIDASESDFADKNEIDINIGNVYDSDLDTCTCSPGTEKTKLLPKNIKDNCLRIKKKHGIRIAQLNIRTLLSNIDNLQLMVNDFKFDLIALNETRLSSEIKDVQIGIHDYCIYRKDRNKNGGGVAIYVNENKLSHKLRSDLLVNDIELVAVEVKQPMSSPMIVLAWYRPPGTSIELFKAIENILLKIDEERKDIIFLGDFNCNILADPLSCYTKRLLEICQNYSLSQMIKEPTWVTPLSSTLIDLIYTSNCEKVVESGVIHLGISDHSLVYIVWGRVRKSFPNHVYRTYRTYKNFNVNDFCDDLGNIDWQSVFTCTDADSSLHEFQTKFSTLCNLQHYVIYMLRSEKVV